MPPKVTSDSVGTHRAIRPPSPLAVLIGLLNDPVSVELAFRWCRRTHREFPAASGPLVAWRLLLLAGIGAPYAPTPEQFARVLQQGRFRLIPASQAPEAGDVFVTVGADGAVAGCGLVAKVHRQGGVTLIDWFLAVDETLQAECRPYRRHVAGSDDQAPVLYWLRVPG